MIGRVHSIETLGAVDGPGVRCVVFLQGCPMRCLYCHNPETWPPQGGEARDSEEVLRVVERCRPYFSEEGGVTLSGGEPLMQAEFCLEVLRACRERGIHTAIDTCGYYLNDTVRQCLEHTGLVLLDIKHTDPARHRELTGCGPERALAFLEEVTRRGIALWVRQVIVPGFNDREEDARALAALLKGRANLRRVELLPYHRMAEARYRELSLPYPLADTPEPTPNVMQRLREVMAKALGAVVQ